jgi:hypothetical protein
VSVLRFDNDRIGAGIVVFSVERSLFSKGQAFNSTD